MLNIIKMLNIIIEQITQHRTLIFKVSLSTLDNTRKLTLVEACISQKYPVGGKGNIPILNRKFDNDTLLNFPYTVFH
jgi:hypothetical protein